MTSQGDKQKKCTMCKKVKNIEDFCKDSSRPRGISYRCRTCEKEYLIKRHNTPSYKKSRRIGSKKYKSLSIKSK